MRDPEVFVGSFAVVGALAGLLFWYRARRARLRRAAFRAAARRAGLDPGPGPWVEARVADTEIRGREEEIYRNRQDPLKVTTISAKLTRPLPEAFHASTNEGAIGLLRASFPTVSGRHTVYVRGLDPAAVEAFVEPRVRQAFAEAFDLAPFLEIEDGKASVSALRWFGPAELERMFRGVARVCEAMSERSGGFRDPGR